MKMDSYKEANESSLLAYLKSSNASFAIKNEPFDRSRTHEFKLTESGDQLNMSMLPESNMAAHSIGMKPDVTSISSSLSLPDSEPDVQQFWRDPSTAPIAVYNEQYQPSTFAYSQPNASYDFTYSNQFVNQNDSSAMHPESAFQDTDSSVLSDNTSSHHLMMTSSSSAGQPYTPNNSYHSSNMTDSARVFSPLHVQTSIQSPYLVPAKPEGASSSVRYASFEYKPNANDLIVSQSPVNNNNQLLVLAEKPINQQMLDHLGPLSSGDGFHLDRYFVRNTDYSNQTHHHHPHDPYNSPSTQSVHLNVNSPLDNLLRPCSSAAHLQSPCIHNNQSSILTHNKPETSNGYDQSMSLSTQPNASSFVAPTIAPPNMPTAIELYQRASRAFEVNNHGDTNDNDQLPPYLSPNGEHAVSNSYSNLLLKTSNDSEKPINLAQSTDASSIDPTQSMFDCSNQSMHLPTDYYEQPHYARIIHDPNSAVQQHETGPSNHCIMSADHHDTTSITSVAPTQSQILTFSHPYSAPSPYTQHLYRFNPMQTRSNAQPLPAYPHLPQPTSSPQPPPQSSQQYQSSPGLYNFGAKSFTPEMFQNALTGATQQPSVTPMDLSIFSNNHSTSQMTSPSSSYAAMQPSLYTPNGQHLTANAAFIQSNQLDSNCVYAIGPSHQLPNQSVAHWFPTHYLDRSATSMTSSALTIPNTCNLFQSNDFTNNSANMNANVGSNHLNDLLAAKQALAQAALDSTRRFCTISPKNCCVDSSYSGDCCRDANGSAATSNESFELSDSVNYLDGTARAEAVQLNHMNDELIASSGNTHHPQYVSKSRLAADLVDAERAVAAMAAANESPSYSSPLPGDSSDASMMLMDGSMGVPVKKFITLHEAANVKLEKVKIERANGMKIYYFKCSLCNYQTNTSQSMKDHLYCIHCKAKNNYKCNICHQTFGWKNNAQRHMRRKHKIEDQTTKREAIITLI
jgi:hypothetical protein